MSAAYEWGVTAAGFAALIRKAEWFDPWQPEPRTPIHVDGPSAQTRAADLAAMEIDEAPVRDHSDSNDERAEARVRDVFPTSGRGAA